MAAGGGPAAQLLAVLAQKVVGLGETGMGFGKPWRQRRLGPAIGGAVILGFGGDAKSLEDAQAVGIQGKQARRLGKEQDLVGTWFADHGERGESSASLREWQAERRAEASIEASEDKLGGLPKPGRAGGSRNRAPEAGNRLQCSGRCVEDRPWCHPDLGVERGIRLAALTLGHQVGDLLPKDEAERVGADGPRWLPIVLAETAEDPGER
jgi:hypothetical protein